MYINLFEDESNKPVFGADIQVQKLGEELTWRQKNVTSDLEFGRHDLYRIVPHYRFPEFFCQNVWQLTRLN